MSNSFKIKIPRPCHENWDAMQPKGCGRFCNSCEKLVIDFTKWSDEEFVSYFQNTETIPCGRLSQTQLALSIPPKTQPFFRFGKMSKYMAASMLAAISMQQNTWAQKNLTEQSVNSKSELRSSPQVIDKVKMLIKGTVEDENGETIPGAIVRFKDSELGTITDIEGNFILETNVEANSYTIIVRALTMDEKEAEVMYNAKNKIILNSGDITMGIVVYELYKPTLWQRITKPFRKKQ